jgi:hypothetical protein
MFFNYILKAFVFGIIGSNLDKIYFGFRRYRRLKKINKEIENKKRKRSKSF